MKKVMAVLAALALGTQVQAQEAVQVSWRGAYLGAEISHDRTNWGRVQASGAVSNEWEVSGTSLGVIGGYNWQRGALVYGVEAGLFSRDVKGDDNGWGSVVDAVDMKQAAELGLRMGYAHNRNLYYVTLGRQWANGDQKLNSVSIDHTFKATYLGFGLEHALGAHMRLRGEVRATDYKTVPFTVPSTTVQNAYRSNPRPELRLGMTYQF